MISMIIIGDQVAPIFVGIQISLQLSWDPWGGPTIGRQTNQPKMNWICQNWYMDFSMLLDEFANYRGTPGADHWKTNQPSKDELMVLAMMWPAPIIKGIIYVEREVNIWYEENWGDMTMACNRTRANLCDNCICCISSIWLKVATAVSNHEMHVTFSFCCDFSILFNFKWQGCISSILLKVAMPVSDYGKMLDTSSFCCNFSILFNFKWQGLHFFYSLESCHGSFQLWEALFGPPSHMPERTKLTNIHIWCGIVRLL